MSKKAYNKALLADNFSAVLQNYRRARRYCQGEGSFV